MTKHRHAPHPAASRCWPLLLAVLLAACSGQSPAPKPKSAGPRCLLPDSVQLHEGDVVFRLGDGLMSHAVMAADAGGNYSHCGIVADSAGVMLVVHAVPGEPDFEGDPDRVKADLPQRFFDRSYACVGEVCRIADEQAARLAARKAWQVYRRHTLFDHDYNDADTTRMYCSELVVFAYRHAGVDLAEGRSHGVNVPFIKAEACIFPSDVHASELLHTIATF